MARRRSTNLLSSEDGNKAFDDATDDVTATAEPAADAPNAENLDAEETAIAPHPVPTEASTVAESPAAKQDEAAPHATPNPQQDETLLQQIADLTAALDAQKVTIEQLKTELEPMNALKAELEETRNEVRQLADSNAKLTQELKTLQTQKPATETGTWTTKPASPSYQELRISSPPIAATSNPPNAFNKDVGWFD